MSESEESESESLERSLRRELAQLRGEIATLRRQTQTQTTASNPPPEPEVTADEYWAARGAARARRNDYVMPQFRRHGKAKAPGEMTPEEEFNVQIADLAEQLSDAIANGAELRDAIEGFTAASRAAQKRLNSTRASSAKAPKSEALDKPSGQSLLRKAKAMAPGGEDSADDDDPVDRAHQRASAQLWEGMRVNDPRFELACGSLSTLADSVDGIEANLSSLEEVLVAASRAIVPARAAIGRILKMIESDSISDQVQAVLDALDGEREAVAAAIERAIAELPQNMAKRALEIVAAKKGKA